MIRRERTWSPIWRRLLRVSERLGISLAGPRYARLILLPGFGVRFTPAAIGLLVFVSVRVLLRRESRVAYAGSRSLLIFETGASASTIKPRLDHYRDQGVRARVGLGCVEETAVAEQAARHGVGCGPGETGRRSANRMVRGPSPRRAGTARLRRRSG